MFRILHLNTKRDQTRYGLVWFLVAIVSAALLIQTNVSSYGETGKGTDVFRAIMTVFGVENTKGDLIAIKAKKQKLKTWKASMSEAFQEAYNVNYGAVFRLGGLILDTLPPSPITEAALEGIYNAVEFVVSHGGLLRHDLTGRIYHSNVGYSLAKTYATYYTKISTAELLASLAIENTQWNCKVGDFACGSGTLLVAAYHRKLMLSYMNNFSGSIEDLHTQFIQESIWGLMQCHLQAI